MEAPSAPLRPLMPGQCMLLVDAPFMWAYKLEDPLWLDGLYVRWTTPRNASERMETAMGVAQALVFLTHVTLQGNGEGGTPTPFGSVLEVSGDEWTEVYAEGVFILRSLRCYLLGTGHRCGAFRRLEPLAHVGVFGPVLEWLVQPLLRRSARILRGQHEF